MTSSFKVREVGPKEAAACREFICSHPDGSIFHTWQWLQAVMEGMTWVTEPCYLVAYQGSEIAGLLPAIVDRLFRQPVLRTLPWGRWLRRALLSTSWTASEALLDAFHERCLRHQAMSAELLVPAGEERGYFMARVGKPTRIIPRFTQIVELPDRYETHWSTTYDNKTRNILRKARSEVVLQQVEDESRLPAYYRLYRDTMSYTENANHLYPESLLVSLWRHFAPDQLRLIEARHDDELIGGAVFLYWEEQVHYWSAAGMRPYRSFNATSHLVDSTIQHAIAQGYRYLNMGSSISHGSGLYRFKQQFGATYLDCDTLVVLFRPDGLIAADGNGAEQQDAGLQEAVDGPRAQPVGGVAQELLSLTPRRRISLSKRQLPGEETWLVYAVDGAEEARLASEIQDQGLSLEPSAYHGRQLRLNRTGLAIWELCDGAASVAEVADEIAHRFGVPPPQALRDVTTFMQELARQDLIDLTWTPL